MSNVEIFGYWRGKPGEINEKYSDRDRAEMWRDYFETTALELAELKENYTYLVDE